MAQVKGTPILVTSVSRLGSPGLLVGIQQSPDSFQKAGTRVSYSVAARHSGKRRDRNEQDPVVLVRYLKHLYLEK